MTKHHEDGRSFVTVPGEKPAVPDLRGLFETLNAAHEALS
jgi:hypothetical protein